MQHGAGGRLVDAARLHADESALDQVGAPDAVPSGDRVQLLHQLHRSELPALERDRHAALEADAHGFGPRGLAVGIGCELVERLGRFVRRILERAALVRDVPEVGVAREQVALLGRHRDAVPLGVGERVLARDDVPLAPRGDHGELGRERQVGELEAHLVVALPGAAVGDGIGVRLQRARHLASCDERAGERRAEEVGPLVDRACAQRGEAEVAHEREPQILDHDVARPALARARLEAFELSALPHVRAVADDLAPVGLLEPRHDDAGVEAARVGEHRAPHLLLHASCVRVLALAAAMQRLPGLHIVPPFLASSSVTARSSFSTASAISASVTVSGGRSRTARSPPRSTSSPCLRAAATSAGGS